jgi:hypothetical protein
MRRKLREAGVSAVLILFLGWVAVAAYNLFVVVVLLLRFTYWTDGTYHDPRTTTISAVSVLGFLPWFALGLVGATRRASRGDVSALAVMSVAGLLAGVSAVPYFIHVAEVQITSRGFAQSRYETDDHIGLTLVNRTSAPVRVCAGRHGDCDGASPPKLASGGVVVSPGAVRRIPTPTGTHRLTIADAPPDLARPNATVKVNPGIEG